MRTIESNEVCGLGTNNFRNSGLKVVLINTNEICWNGRDDIEKEVLMFHELGHAVLGREHLNTRFSNRMPKSMMCGAESCNPFLTYNSFTPELRNYYCDELFDPLVGTPRWVKNPTFSEIIYSENFDTIKDEWINIQSEDSSENQYTSSYSDKPGTTNGALRISSQSSQGSNREFSSWTINLSDLDLPPGKSIKMSVNILSPEIGGEGIAFSMQTLSGTDLKLSSSVTSEDSQKILTQDRERSYELVLPYTPEHIEILKLSLTMLGGTSGTVYFDDVEIMISD